jgi:D-amino-acid dehydrogenase
LYNCGKKVFNYLPNVSNFLLFSKKNLRIFPKKQQIYHNHYLTMKNIYIIGGGIIGLFSAYYLEQRGYQITIIEQSDMTDGCSFGNAGMVVPSHIIPLAAPGMMQKGFKMLFNSQSPFYIKPRLSSSLLKWGYHFYKSSTENHVQKSIPILRDISLLSRELYAELSHAQFFHFGFKEKGLLMLYKTEHVQKEEIETAKMANKAGIEAHVLSAKEVQALETEIAVDVMGGIYFPKDAHLIPQILIKQLIDYLIAKGVRILDKTEVRGFEKSNGRVQKIVTSSETLEDIQEIVLAGGAWSPLLTTQLGVSLPLQSGKGYSFTLKNREKNVQIPSILTEAKVAVTPMANDLRFAGTMEITDIDLSINMQRVKGIVQSIPNYYPQINPQIPEKQNIWKGLRPCSPDGLPYIGRSRFLNNLVIATGHAMMGISLAPATGKLVEEIISQQKLSMNIDDFAPERFA